MFLKAREYKFKESVIWKINENGNILILDLNADNDEFLQLDSGAATEAFLKLTEGVPKDKIIKHLSLKYDADEIRIESDLQNLISDLSKNLFFES